MSDVVKPPGGGNGKYVIGGVLLLLGAIAVAVFLSQKSRAPGPAQTPPTPAAPEEVTRVNPLAQPELILEDEPEDAGAEEPEEEPKAKKPRNAPRRDSWECSGDLDRGALQKVVREHRQQVRTCYERRLKVNNLLQGDVSLKIKVGANGKVSAVAASGSLNDSEVLSCMKRQAQSWRFSVPTGGNCAVIAVPFQFSPKN